jgi:plasmid stabilization system protein ParE
MYKVQIEDSAKIDLAEILDYYSGLENESIAYRFFDQFIECIANLKNHPQFQIRYKNIHCLPIIKFPYMIHFIVDNELLTCKVFGIISTHQDPKDSWKY